MLNRWPVIRRRSPWLISIAFHGPLAIALLSFGIAPQLRGEPEADPNVIEIFIVPPDPEAGAPASADPVPVEQVQEEVPENEAAETDIEQEEDRAETQAPTPPAPAAVIRTPSNVRVPDVDEGRGTPDGIVALDCYAEFDDPVRAAECAGQEITSDWRSTYTAAENEQWLQSAERLRAGRYRSPFEVGPDRFGDLGENEELYQSRDNRFNVLPGPTTFSGDNAQPGRAVASGGANYAEAFETVEEYNRYLALRDERIYVGDGGPRPLTGWRPSWQLRDDPHIDPEQMRQFLESLPEETETDQ
ncbi:MAG: hypothetical protein AAGA69_07190 [Pseudomonadota bacterium]